MATGLSFDRARIADFCRKWDIAELAVFGSVARGESRDNSDVDVLVTFAPCAHVGLLSLGRMEKELTDIFGRKVDLVTKGGLKPLIRDEILADAEVLYAA